ncbi:hypothetical protein STEG23_004622 [Scotinomys teguina]
MRTVMTSSRVLNVQLAPGAFGKAVAERSGAAASRVREPRVLRVRDLEQMRVFISSRVSLEINPIMEI